MLLILKLVAPLTDHDKLLDWPGLIVRGLAVKKDILGLGVGVGTGVGVGVGVGVAVGVGVEVGAVTPT